MFQDQEQYEFKAMLEAVNQGLSNDELFGSAEAAAACQVMDGNNELMFGDDGNVYRI